MSNFKEQTNFTHNRLIKQYYNQLKPDMNYDDFEEICVSVFRHFKKTLSNNDLHEFQFMYLGKFKVLSGFIINHFKNNKRRWQKQLISEKVYNSYNDMYMRYINKYPKKFNKYKNIITEWNSL